jgi:hypothetical protein
LMLAVRTRFAGLKPCQYRPVSAYGKSGTEPPFRERADAKVRDPSAAKVLFELIEQSKRE